MTARTADGVVSFLESTLGLRFAGPRRARMVATLEAQRRAARLSPEGYLAELERLGPTFDRLVAEVTVGETYFFRDRVQCDLLRHVVLAALAGSTPADSVIAVWSAGCASGEEAVTVAALAEAEGLGERCLVVGTDASGRAIEKARDGVYGPWSMRSITPLEQAACFHREGDRFRVVERLRARTRFVQGNLLDGPPPPGTFDVVLCRNLLIYLTPDAVDRAARVLTEAMKPEGWLITAAGDPPLRAPGLVTVRTPYGQAYRHGLAVGKPAPGKEMSSSTPDGPATVTASPARAGSPRTTPAAAARTSPGVPVPREPAPPSGPRSGTATPNRPLAVRTPAAVLVQQVRELGDSGQLDTACAAAAEAVRAHPLDVELRYLAGVVLLETGRLDEAATAASRAVYLAPELPAAHILLGQVEHARGNTDRARRSLRNGSRLLAAADDGTPVALAGDVPATHLADVVARYLSTPEVAR